VKFDAPNSVSVWHCTRLSTRTTLPLSLLSPEHFLLF
jgi:hypothetical protein